MGVSVGGGGGVKAEPNVVPMIDVMLVLLIIFMVVTPTVAAGFTAIPPSGVNLKAHPEADEDQVLGIDRTGQYFLNKSPIPNSELGQRLQAIYQARTIDAILYVKADKDLEYGRLIEAMDIASKNGVSVIGAITDQTPGTKSAVDGDDAAAGSKKP